MQLVIQITMAFLGVIGFSIKFNIHHAKVLIIGVGGALSWIVYSIIFYAYQDKVLACFVATTMIAILAELLARLIKTPVILLLVPMLVPLIPGSDLYYMMLYVIHKDAVDSGKFGFLLAGETAAIALGIIVATTVMQIIFRTIQYLQGTD